MKKMKKLVSFAMVALLVFSCSKIDLLDMDFDPNAPNDGVLKILVSGPGEDGLKSTSATMGDTVKIEGGNTYNFSYESTIPMQSVQWTFSNNGNTSQDNLASNHYQRVFTVSFVTLVGVDENGTQHSAQIWLNNLPRVAGDPILYKGKTFLGANLYRQEFWVYKNGAYMAPLNYKFKGNITSPSWTVLIDIPSADTNYRMSGNQLYAMPSGQTGHWVKVYLDTPTNFSAEVAVLVRLTQNVGEQWASFKGSQFVRSDNFGKWVFYVDADGNVVPEGGSTSSMPGQGGDDLIRFSINSNFVSIFQKNEANAISPWIQFSYNDSWATPVYASTPVNEFPGWSEYVISKDNLPARAQYGGNINTMSPNPNMGSSIYYDQIYGGLYIDITGL